MVTNLKAVLGAARNCGAIFVIWDFRKTITAYCAITAIVDEPEMMEPVRTKLFILGVP